MTIQHVIFIVIYMIYSTSSDYTYSGVDPYPIITRSQVSLRSSYNPYEDEQLNIRIVFEAPVPNYQASDQPTQTAIKTQRQQSSQTRPQTDYARQPQQTTQRPQNIYAIQQGQTPPPQIHFPVQPPESTRPQYSQTANANINRQTNVQNGYVAQQQQIYPQQQQTPSVAYPVPQQNSLRPQNSQSGSGSLAQAAPNHGNRPSNIQPSYVPPQQQTASAVYPIRPQNSVRPQIGSGSSAQAPVNNDNRPSNIQPSYVPPQQQTPSAVYPQNSLRPQNAQTGSGSSSQAPANRPTNIQTTTTKSVISEGIYNLGQQILSRAIDQHGRSGFKSEVISPLSIAGVSYLLYLGSAGKTENELANFLGLNRVTNQKEIHQQFGQLLDEIVHDRETNNELKEYPEETEYRVHEISVANALFLNQYFAVRPQFANVARSTYQSDVTPMDFATQGRQAKRYIDNWVSNKTHGKIPNILAEAPSRDTQAIVVSALYFKALWWEDLGVISVVKQPFYFDSDRPASIKVNTIVFTSEYLPHYESAEMNCRIIGLKYQKQLSTMYIIQPLHSNAQSLRDLQTQLTANKLEYLISRMTPIYASTLTVPKFHLQNQIELKPIFEQMGVTSLFANPNLAPITPSQNESPIQVAPYTNDLDYLDAVRKSSRTASGISITQIQHKVDLVVNEKGTEGGAATAAYADKIFGKTIKINSPFLFVVRQDNTRLPLFYGVVLEPEQD